MASVDSGVETGNDSNDSSIVQHEYQYATAVANPIAAAANIAAVITGQATDNEIASAAITDAHESNNSFLPTTNYLTSLRPHWPTDTTLNSVTDHCKFDDKEVSLAPHTIEEKWRRKQILKRYKGNLPLCKRRVTEIRLRDPKEYTTLSLEDYSRLSLRERAAICDWRLKSEWAEWRKPLNERKMRLAAASNDVNTIKQLLRLDVSPNNHDVEGRTPLHHAACRGYTEIVCLLLDHGADPNRRDRVGNTPLHLAAVTSKIAVVTPLLEAGTDVRSMDQHGFNPLHLAQAKLKMLQNCKYGSTEEIKEEMHDIVKMLMVYFNKQKNMNEQIETLNNFCSRLSLASTSDHVQDDLKDLLANIETLNITS